MYIKVNKLFCKFYKKDKKRLVDFYNKLGIIMFEKMCYKYRILKILKWYSVMLLNGFICLKLMFFIFMFKGVFLMINYNFIVSK